jgi:hypothetical protein
MMSEYLEYQPVPVYAARRLAEEFGKEVVIILAWDHVHDRLHTTTYGRADKSKWLAADAGIVAARALGAQIDMKQYYEDFRTEVDTAKFLRSKELLRASWHALQSLIACREALADSTLQKICDEITKVVDIPQHG